MFCFWGVAALLWLQSTLTVAHMHSGLCTVDKAVHFCLPPCPSHTTAVAPARGRRSPGSAKVALPDVVWRPAEMYDIVTAKVLGCWALTNA